MVPYIDRAISGENVYSQDIIDTTSVSYTHLDVYKRQPFPLRGFGGTPDSKVEEGPLALSANSNTAFA